MSLYPMKGWNNSELRFYAFFNSNMRNPNAESCKRSAPAPFQIVISASQKGGGRPKFTRFLHRWEDGKSLLWETSPIFPRAITLKRTMKLQHSPRFTFCLSAGGILKVGTSTGWIQNSCSKSHSEKNEKAELPLPLPLLSMSLLCLPFPFPGQGITLPHPRLL